MKLNLQAIRLMRIPARESGHPCPHFSLKAALKK